MQNQSKKQSQKRPVLAGLDRLLADNETIERLSHRQVGLLTNHASATTAGITASRALSQRLTEAGAPRSGYIRLSMAYISPRMLATPLTTPSIPRPDLRFKASMAGAVWTKPQALKTSIL